MPANPKYLSKSGWKRFSKVMAAIFGGYFAAVLLHVVFIKHASNDAVALLTAAVMIFVVWVGFMVMVYVIRKAWISWVVLLSVVLVSGSLVYI